MDAQKKKTLIFWGLLLAGLIWLINDLLPLLYGRKLSLVGIITSLAIIAIAFFYKYKSK